MKWRRFYEKLSLLKNCYQLNCGIWPVVAVLLHPLQFNDDIFTLNSGAVEPG